MLVGEVNYSHLLKRSPHYLHIEAASSGLREKMFCDCLSRRSYSQLLCQHAILDTISYPLLASMEQPVF